MSERTKRDVMEYGGKKQEIQVESDRLIQFTDRGGHSICFYRVYQASIPLYWNPVANIRLMEHTLDFKLRDDDVYLAGYLRTGCHWTYEMASMLLNGKAETIEKFKDHMELMSQDDFARVPSPRIVNCHVSMTLAPRDIKLKKLRVIYTLRDPKDVAVSMYNMYYNRPLGSAPYIGKFEDFLQFFLDGTVEVNGYFYHLREAEKYFDENPDVPVFLPRYEDTIQDPVATVQKMSDFLGLKRDDELCRAIADKCHFKNMLVDKEKYSFKIDGRNYLYRKGVSGDWRNYFTEETLGEYYRAYEDKMAGSRFYSLYSRDKD